MRRFLLPTPKLCYQSNLRSFTAVKVKNTQIIPQVCTLNHYLSDLAIIMGEWAHGLMGCMDDIGTCE